MKDFSARSFSLTNNSFDWMSLLNGRLNFLWLFSIELIFLFNVNISFFAKDIFDLIFFISFLWFNIFFDNSCFSTRKSFLIREIEFWWFKIESLTKTLAWLSSISIVCFMKVAYVLPDLKLILSSKAFTSEAASSILSFNFTSTSLHKDNSTFNCWLKVICREDIFSFDTLYWFIFLSNLSNSLFLVNLNFWIFSTTLDIFFCRSSKFFSFIFMTVMILFSSSSIFDLLSK